MNVTGKPAARNAQDFAAKGKPEPLRGPLAGWWSCRIAQEHRLVSSPDG